MRKIARLVVHASGHDPSSSIGAVDLDAIHKAFGDSGIPYHLVILTDGSIERGIPDATIGRHSERYNDDSLAVCLVGGRHPSDEIGGVKKLWPSYLDVQLGALKRVLQSWSAQHSGAKPYGISDLEPDRTQMPGFDVPLWYRGGGLVPTLTTASPYVTDPTNES